MTRRMALALVVYSSWGIFVSSGQARIMPAPPSIPQRIALAEIVILGRVTHIEGQSVMVLETPQAAEKTEYFVAQVHIEEALRGADGLTDLKVAFPALPANWKNFPNGGEDYRLQLETDQEVCLFLKPHHSGEFLVGATYYPSIDKKDASFEPNWKLALKCAKLLANPEQGLEAKEPADRFLTAAMLILHYRTSPILTKGQPKQEAVDAKQSRLILQALAEANWEKPPAELGHEMRPDILFARLNLTAKDGWNQAVTPETAKKWLKEHAEKYRIKKYAADDK